MVSSRRDGPRGSDTETRARAYMLKTFAEVNQEEQPARSSDALDSYKQHETVYTPEQISIESIGIPRRKSRFDWVNVGALLASFVLFAIAVVVVTPQLSLAYSLGYNNQITILGFLLSLQALCMKRVAQKSFLLAEAGYGSSNLANYNAILTSSALVDHASYIWRSILVFLIALPIGLSAAYKQFSDGSATSVLASSGHTYGSFGPPGIDNTGYRTGITVMSNIFFPFLTNTSSESPSPRQALPQTYGYNTLVVNSTDAAMLDGIYPDTVTELQSKLEPLQSWNLTAVVNATYTSYQDPKVWNTTSFWASVPYFAEDEASSNLGEGFQSLNSYDNWFLGYISWTPDATDNTNYMLISLVPVQKNQNTYAAFNQTASLYISTRRQCEGSWNISTASVTLSSATCDGPGLGVTSYPSNSSYNWALGSLKNFYAPLFLEYLGPFQRDRKGSVWQTPTTAATISGAFWSRNAAQSKDNMTAPTYAYLAQDKMESTRQAVRASSLLYFVLIVLPCLTVVASLVNIACWNVPMDNGFDLIAILAGVDADSLKQLKGAGLSGSLKKRVSLAISLAPHNEHQTDAKDITYTIGGPVDTWARRRGNRPGASVIY